eukprot:gene5319-7384_t
MTRTLFFSFSLLSLVLAASFHIHFRSKNSLHLFQNSLTKLKNHGFDCKLKGSVLENLKSELNVTISGGNSDVTQLTSTLDRLKIEREKKRLEYETAEVAVQLMQMELSKQIQNISNSNNQIMTDSYDYGFVSKSGGSMRETAKSVAGGNVPPSIIYLAIDNFKRELNSFIEFIQSKSILNGGSNAEMDLARKKLSVLKLSNAAIWKREEQRPEIEAPWVIKIPYYVLCLLLDVLFDGAPISRFYFLETVARMPYFSYITMLHTYETLGWWRRSIEAKRIHFAEEYNEYHHLLIWESLGGDQDWKVRFFAQHSAIVYFFVLIILWVTSPSLAYNFSELIEAHAVDTYAEFADANEELLKSMAAPVVAKNYYESVDMYVFDEFQTDRPRGSRRPQIHSLYDVVCNIRDDEREHVATMSACQDPNVVVKSPNTEAALVTAGIALVFTAALLSGQEGVFSQLYGNIELGDSANVVDSAANSAADAATAFVTGAVASFKESANMPDSTLGAGENMIESDAIKSSGIISKIIKFISALRF